MLLIKFHNRNFFNRRLVSLAALTWFQTACVNKFCSDLDIEKSVNFFWQTKSRFERESFLDMQVQLHSFKTILAIVNLSIGNLITNHKFNVYVSYQSRSQVQLHCVREWANFIILESKKTRMTANYKSVLHVLWSWTDF